MLDQIIIIVYLVIILGIGLWVGRGMKSFKDFAVAGKSYGHLVIFATLAASFVGGGFSLGNAEKVFLIGITNVVTIWGFSLKEILVAKYIAPRMDNFPDALSIGDVMGYQFGKTGKIITGIFSLILAAGVLGVQIGAIGYIFELFLALPQLWGILIGCGIVIAYSAFGGMKAVIWTDVIQFIVLAIGIPVAVIIGYFEVGGWEAIRAAVPSSHTTILGERTWIVFLSTFLVMFFGELLLPPYAQRLLIGKDASHTARGTMLSGLFSIPFLFLTGLAGLLVFTIDPTINANMALPFLVQNILPIGISGLVVAAIISIVMSSADSFLNSSAIALVHDIVRPLRKKEMSSRLELRYARIATVAVGVGAVYFALTVKSLFDLMIHAYSFWSPVLAVPLLAAIFQIKASVRTFLLGAGSGLLGMIIWTNYLSDPWGINGLLIGIAANFFVFSISRRFD